jgi:hypothetical protein
VKRFFRLWGKKRGERRTGSPLTGTLGEAAFFGSLFLLGLLALASLITSQWLAPAPEWFQIGFGTWVALLVVTTFVLVGGAGLFLTVWEIGASAERRSAIIRRAANIELIREVRTRQDGLPNIPRGFNLTNSPGVKLTYRLPSLESPAWHLTAAAITAILCLTIDAVLVAIAVRAVQRHQPPYALIAFLVPFTAVTGWSTVYFVRQLFLYTWIGPTRIEISDHPLFPGKNYQVYLSQGGHLRVKNLTLRLVCEEEVTFRQGTDLRVERRSVYSQPIFSQNDFTIEPAKDFEHQAVFEIPSEAMHSFQAPHNAIVWKFVVEGTFYRWPAMVRSFPIIVYPSTESNRGTAH